MIQTIPLKTPESSFNLVPIPTVTHPVWFERIFNTNLGTGPLKLLNPFCISCRFNFASHVFFSSSRPAIQATPGQFTVSSLGHLNRQAPDAGRQIR